MSDLSCVKCGGTEVKTTYHIGASYWGGVRRCASGPHAKNYRRDEHLHRDCQTCGFDWTDDVLADLPASQEQGT